MFEHVHVSDRIDYIAFDSVMNVQRKMHVYPYSRVCLVGKHVSTNLVCVHMYKQ